MKNSRAIAIFVEDMWRPISAVITDMMTCLGFKVVEKGVGLDAEIHISKDDKSLDYKLHNTLMEIATIDRDDNPLVFDKKLLEYDHFMKKTERVITSKIQVLLPLLLDENGIDKVKNMKGYERIRIMEIDGGKKANG